MKKSYKVYFNLLLLSGMALFFSSCARDKGMISYNSEKLSKQSLEIENSRSPENDLVVSTLENEVPLVINPLENKPERRITEEKTAKSYLPIGKESKERKISPAQAFIAKKITKKLDSNKTNKLDKNLKIAIIFGAIGLTLFLFFGWPINIVGAVLFTIGVVFLILWAVEQ